MDNRKKVTIITLISAILFCSMTIVASLSPLSEVGKNANQFNSLGMWLSIAMILFFYIVPLLMYRTGLEWVKYIMAVFCALGLLTLISIMFSIAIFGVAKNMLPSLISLLVICGMASITNIIWFFVALPTKKTKSSVGINN
jgi:hypothetical protein